MSIDHSTATGEPQEGRWAELQVLPWWGGVLLTLADLLDRPWVTSLVWVALIVRAGWRGRRPRKSPGNPPASTGS